MNDDFSRDNPLSLTSEPEAQTLGTSSMYRLFEALISLREKNERQHKLFEQTLNRMRDSVQASFNNFAAETQRAYQQMRQEFHGEKRVSLAALNELVDIALELSQIAAARPQFNVPGPEGEALARWIEAVEIQNRKVQAALERHGVFIYHAVIASAYDPRLHERVGSKRVEGMGPLLVAEEREHGYASQQPEFVLRRPKVIISE
jgi:molecular chaperone GrpE (heat shock protein)